MAAPDSIEFSDPAFPTHLDELTALVCSAVRRDPRGYLDEPLTPFCDVGDLMGAMPPGWWRPFARRVYFRRLEIRVRRELESHHQFATGIKATIKRTHRDLRAIATMIDDARRQ